MAANGKKTNAWLRVVSHLIGLLPIGLLALDLFAGRLSVNPIQDIEQRLGRSALYLLIASLSITPLIILSGWHILKSRRRTLGLYAFTYACLHLSIFAGLDYGFDLPQILSLVVQKPYILMGSLAFLLLLPLAITSFNYFIRRLGKTWQRLHLLVYPAAVAVIIHYTWARKGDLVRLQGDIVKPLLLGLLVLLLLLIRLPPIRAFIQHTRQRVFTRA